MKRFLLLSACLILSSCSSDDSESNQTQEFNCVPDEVVWQQEIEPIVQKHCGTCHGEVPDYGAGSYLSDYNALVSARGDIRNVDALALRVSDGTMPPIGMAGMPEVEAKKVVDWASCGDLEVQPNNRLQVSRPVALAPIEAPTDWEFVDMTAPSFDVGEDVQDLYQCFTFESPFDADRFIRRIEVVEDQSAVLHHAVFLRDVDNNAPDEPHECIGMPQGSQYLYAWAPGAGAVQFPDGGMRIKPGERFVLQIHYNNGQKLSDIVDSSGVRLYHGPAEGTEYGMTAPGPLNFAVPGRTVEEIAGTCTIREDQTIFAGMPHMHEIGAAFEQTIVRADGSTEDLVSLTNWDFETQLFYSMPIELKVGDKIQTTCVFDNPEVGMVSSGPRTEDEMCFNFMYVTPPPTTRYCDEFEDEGPLDLEYSPGMCAPAGAIETPELVVGSMVVADAPQLTGGELAEGVYEMTDIQIWRDSADTPIGPIDIEESVILTKGQFVYEGGEFTLDARILSNIILENGQGLEQGNTISFRGTRDMDVTDVIAGEAVCGEAGGDGLRFQVDGDTLTLGIAASAFGVEFESRYIFERQ